MEAETRESTATQLVAGARVLRQASWASWQAGEPEKPRAQATG